MDIQDIQEDMSKQPIKKNFYGYWTNYIEKLNVCSCLV